MSKPIAPNTGLSRRGLLKRATAGGLAVAFPSIVPSTVFSSDKAAAPSERINLGFIGVGKMGSSHLTDHVGRTAVQIVGICDVEESRREHFAKLVSDKYAANRGATAKCPTYSECHELLSQKDLDAVVIATPDHWHTAILIEACKAKKDIYAEKPLTLTIGEARTAIEAVRKHNVVFQTGSQQRSEGPFAEVVQRIHEGQLGKLKEVFVALGGTHSVPCDLPAEEPKGKIDWNRWLGQAPERPYNSRLAHAGETPDAYPFNPGWREFKEFSGGFVTDWGAHHIDITQWALQMDGNGPAEILPPAKEKDQYGGKLIYRGSPAGDEIVVQHVEVIPNVGSGKPSGKANKKKGGDDGKAAEGGKGEKNGILFVGEKGSIFVNRSTVIANPPSLLEQELKTPIVKVSQQKKGIHRTNWLECIKSRQRPTVDVHIGAGSVTACHLLNLAYWNRQPMKWDAKKWTFADPAQNAWLTRPRRKGFELPDIG